MVSIRRLQWRAHGVADLIDALDAYQIGLYGVESCNLEPTDLLDRSGAILMGAFDGAALMGIGAIKLYESYAEIKRVYFKPAYRGSGAAPLLVRELEAHARVRGLTTIYLETAGSSTPRCACMNVSGIPASTPSGRIGQMP